LNQKKCGNLFWYFYFFLLLNQCFIKMPASVSQAFRPVEKCDFCQGIQEAKALSNVSPDEFEEKYAYSGIPAIVTDAMQNWTAQKVGFRKFYKIFRSIIHHS
jgi:histone arginine demethylase JMJD6